LIPLLNRDDLKTALVVGGIILITILVIAIELRAQPVPKQAFMVCEGKCLKSVKLSEHSQLVAPLVDGKPDYKHALLSSVVVDVDHSYERIEMRPAQ
jgi:hypothetical protein